MQACRITGLLLSVASDLFSLSRMGAGLFLGTLKPVFKGGAIALAKGIAEGRQV
jgi:hypothetical protein